MSDNPKLCALRDQLAFYFSDANLRKDRFLLRLTGPRGTGEVRVQELMGFNRVQALVGDDQEAVCAALRLISEVEVADDGVHVWRVRELPLSDDSDDRTVYIEPLSARTDREAVQRTFAQFGTVTYISLPRLPSGDVKGFAFVEFELPDAAVAAATAAFKDSSAAALVDGAGPLRVMHKRAWTAMKAEYKRALEEGRQEAEAHTLSREAAAEADAAIAAMATDEAAARRVVLVSGLPRGGTAVKAIRREMREVFSEVAPMEFVDYGISNSGDVTVAYVRMATPVGAAEAVRQLSASGRALSGHAVRFELMRGEALREYTERILALRQSTAETRKVKRDKWWNRKYGSSADAATTSDKADAADVVEAGATTVAVAAEGPAAHERACPASKRGREAPASPAPARDDSGTADCEAKRARVESSD